MNTAAQQKRLLRRAVLAKRKKLPDDERLLASEAATQRFFGLDEVGGAGSVMAFASFGPEISTRGILQSLFDREVRVLMPWVDGTNLAAAAIASMDDLEPGYGGILEPATRRAVAPAADVIMVPGVAFDPTGRRLGYGGGFYDRFLATAQGFRVGLCFDCQIAQEVPVTDQDQAVQAVITESRTLRMPGR